MGRDNLKRLILKIGHEDFKRHFKNDKDLNDYADSQPKSVSNTLEFWKIQNVDKDCSSNGSSPKRWLEIDNLSFNYKCCQNHTSFK